MIVGIVAVDLGGSDHREVVLAVAIDFRQVSEENDPPAKARKPAARPAPKLAPPIIVSDKLNHFLAFGVLALCWTLGYRRYPLRLRAAGLLGLSVSIQVVQYLSVSREPDVLDFAHDAAGIGFGILVGVGALRLLSRNSAGVRRLLEMIRPPIQKEVAIGQI